MSAATTHERSRSRGRSLLDRVWPALLLFVVLFVGFALFLRLSSRGRIQPGVRIGTVDVGGLTPTEAMTALLEAGMDPQAPVVVHAGEGQWSLAPSDAGLMFDARSTIAEAYAVGRRGLMPRAMRSALEARLTGKTIQPQVVADHDTVRIAVEGIADSYDRPAVDASLRIDGTVVSQIPAAEGQAINVDAAVESLLGAAEAGVWPVQGLALPAAIIPPVVTDASAAVSAASSLLAEDVTLAIDEESWVLNPPTLAPMLTTSRQGNTVVLDIDRARFGQWLEPVTEVVSRTARLPRFHFDQQAGDLELTEPGLTGRRIDIDRTIENVLAAGHGGRPQATVAVREWPPAVADTARATDLGIRELLREETSHFMGSPAGRVHNIELAASKFDGLLVPPGAVFSFNEAIGDITAEEGYEKTLIIMDGTTTDGVGGGVCQVSTTLFRAAFWTGLPIVERYAHGYRVAYYEQQSIPGLDATVYRPVVDLKFKNDTPGWILIETETDPAAATLTFRLFGTDTGRDVALEGPTITDTVPPPAPRIEVDPTLAPGETQILEYARNGATVTVTRIVTEGGESSREVFYSHYRPTGKVTAVGPRTRSPGSTLAAAPSVPPTTTAGATP